MSSQDLKDQALNNYAQGSQSCNQGQPFITLGGGTAPSINYNLPQKSGFTVSGFVGIIDTAADFNDEFINPPENNVWQQLQTMLGDNSADLMPFIKTLFSNTTLGSSLLKYESGIGFFKNPAPTTGLQATRKAIVIEDPIEDPGGGSGGSGNQGNPDFTPILNPPDKTILNQVNYNAEWIKFLLTQSKFPIIKKNFFGDIILDFVPIPEPEPEIFLVFHYRVQSYLGNYGAGKVVKTMSLLPGEKTVITVKTFKELTESSKYSDNVLDSFSQTSAQSMENMLESENSVNKVKSAGFTLGLKIGLGKIGTLNAGGGINRSTNSLSKVINRSLSKHVEESQAQRKVEVNNETTTTATESETV